MFILSHPSRVVPDLPAFVAQHLPPWLQAAEPHKVRAWFAAMREAMPHRDALAERLRPLQAPTVHAAERLLPALRTLWPEIPDPLSLRLSCQPFGVRVGGKRAGPLGPRQVQPLLEAALGNFPADHASYSAARRYLIHDASGAQRLDETEALRFVALCRTLDLGGAYQRHLRHVLCVDAPMSARLALHSIMAASQHAALREQAGRAWIRGELSDEGFAAIDALARQQADVRLHGRRLRAHRLRLLACDLADAWVFHAGEGPCIVYLPGVALAPLKEYADTAAFAHDLATSLRDPQYQASFSSLLAKRDVAAFRRTARTWLDETREYLDGSVRVDEGRRPHLALEVIALSDRFYLDHGPLRIQRLLDDARFLYPATADLDFQARVAWVESVVDWGMTLAGVAALFLPGLNAVLLPLMGAQLMGAMFSGVQAWEQGDTEQALGYLESIALNLAVGAVVGAGLAGLAEAAKVVVPRLLARLQRVVLPDGQVRLIDPQLPGYDLPAGVQPAEGQRVLQLDERRFAARERSGRWTLEHPSDPDAYRVPLQHDGQGGWRHLHERPETWSTRRMVERLVPEAKSLSEQQWAQFDAIMAPADGTLRYCLDSGRPAPESLGRQVQRISAHAQVAADVHEVQLPPAVLRLLPRLLVEAPRWPSELGLRVTQEVFQATHAQPSRFIDIDPQALADGTWLAHIGETLEPVQRDALLGPIEGFDAKARSAALRRYLQAQWARERRRIFEALAPKLMDAAPSDHLSRAIEGLYLKGLDTPDSARLTLLCVQRMSNWPKGLRLELRMGDYDGPVLASLGAPGSGDIRVIVRSTEGYSAWAEGERLQALHADPWDNDLPNALLHALPDAAREALGLTLEDAQALRLAVQRTARVHRSELATWLWGPDAVRPSPRSTGRLRGGGSAPSRQAAHGQEGDSAANRLYRDLFPGANDAERAADFQYWRDVGRTPLEQLRNLEAQGRRLNLDLLRWAGNSASRRSIHQALVEAWQRHSFRALDDVRRYGVDLSLNELTDADLAGLPELVGHFDHIQWLDLSNNLLTQMPDALIARFPALRTLELEHNQIVLPDANAALPGLMHLEVLDLSHNPLSGAPDLTGMVWLRNLRLYGVGLAQIPDSILALGQLSEVDLGHNPIQSLPLVLFEREPAQLRGWIMDEYALDAASLERSRAYYYQHGIDLGWPGVPDDLLLEGATEEQRARWQRLRVEPDALRFFRLLGVESLEPAFPFNQAGLNARIQRLLDWMERIGAVSRHDIYIEPDITLTSVEQGLALAFARALPEGALRDEAMFDLLAAMTRQDRLELWLHEQFPELAHEPDEGVRAAVIELYAFRLGDAVDLLDYPAAEVVIPHGDPEMARYFVDFEVRRAQALVQLQAPITAEVALEREFWVTHVEQSLAEPLQALASGLGEQLEDARNQLTSGAYVEEAARLQRQYDEQRQAMLLQRTLDLLALAQAPAAQP